VSDSLLCRCIFAVQLAVVDGFSERLNRSMSVAYARFGKLGTQTGFVSGNGELEDVVRVCGDAALGEEEIVCKEESEDWCELEERLIGAEVRDCGIKVPSFPRPAARTSQSHP
jgi:hypothetical protein